MLTWNDLVQMEPRLAELMAQATEIKYGDRDQLWYGSPDAREMQIHNGSSVSFKHRMSRLVGMHSHTNDEILISSEAYDVAYEALYAALPNCRHEGPFC